jgi:hypothetical protein
MTSKKGHSYIIKYRGGDKGKIAPIQENADAGLPTNP